VSSTGASPAARSAKYWRARFSTSSAKARAAARLAPRATTPWFASNTARRPSSAETQFAASASVPKVA
jgi:hypothetical protein